MATIYGDIQGIRFARESVGKPGECLVEIAFNMPIYTAASDNGQLGGTGTLRNGVAITAGDTLQTLIQKQRRDGKTIALSAVPTSVALLMEHGRQGVIDYWIQTPAVSAGNLTFNVSNAAGTEIDAAAGVFDRPILIGVWVTLT